MASTPSSSQIFSASSWGSAWLAVTRIFLEMR